MCVNIMYVRTEFEGLRHFVKIDDTDNITFREFVKQG